MGASFAIILPARYDSSRFPGKPLAEVAGKPLIAWAYERALRVRGAAFVAVATDDERIARAVEAFGGAVVMTSREMPTGTDRVAEASRQLAHDIVVNLQGDEPVVPGGLVEAMVSLVNEAGADMATACHAIRDAAEMENPNAVKVVMGGSGRALYFSRSPIPYGAWRDLHGRSGGKFRAYRHIGIYAYRKEALMRFASAPRSVLEQSEGLEQLRALDLGMDVRVAESKECTAGVDVPADIINVEKMLLKNYTGGGRLP
ncbi:MAG: 3-deoxy-manno-octulosonate cytidylyltransferase [Chitinivibrionia bacterium]|nr:3-deoxy-manno-octulosonate cytidylyltransferase [Chitinivibrionia bacterium]